MLAVALNSIGISEEEKFGAVFVELFKDFKVIKINPCDDLNQGRLELCQPVEYEELVKDIQAHWDASSTFLELRGLKDKVQRAIRQMFFFDEEKKYEKVLLQGCDGIFDFPWALQILIVQSAVPSYELDPERMGQVDVLIVNSTKEKESRELMDKVKIIRPNLPVFIENIQEGLSQELKKSLEDLFAVYQDKRQKIKGILEENYPEQAMSCEQARKMARKLRVSLFLFGNVCDECGYRITRCGLGCF